MDKSVTCPISLFYPIPPITVITYIITHNIAPHNTTQHSQAMHKKPQMYTQSKPSAFMFQSLKLFILSLFFVTERTTKYPVA